MSKFYNVTNLRKGHTWYSLTEKEVAALLVEVAGGGYSIIQTYEAIRLQNKLDQTGELITSTLKIEVNQA